MFLTVLSPVGTVTSLDLAATSIWRIAFREMPVPGAETGSKGLALGIEYTAMGTNGFAAIACLDCKITGDDLKPVAMVGLPGGDRARTKERLREALAVLINSLDRKVADQIGADSARLVDAYYDLVEGLWGFKGTLEKPITAAVRGEFDGGGGGAGAAGGTAGGTAPWKWALTTTRFEGWLTKSDGGAAGLGLSALPARPPADPNVLPPAPAQSMAPPPSARAAPSTPPTGGDELGADPLGPPPTEGGKRAKKGGP
jgi:hypothetical protein